MGLLMARKSFSGMFDVNYRSRLRRRASRLAFLRPFTWFLLLFAALRAAPLLPPSLHYLPLSVDKLLWPSRLGFGGRAAVPPPAARSILTPLFSGPQLKSVVASGEIDDDAPAAWVVPPLRAELLPQRGSAAGTRMAATAWTEPQVLTYHMRRSKWSDDIIDLFVYTAGVSLGQYNRAFTVIGCLVGDSVHPLSQRQSDVFMCNVKGSPKPAQTVSVVIIKNHNVLAALNGPVTLQLGLRVTIDPARLVDLPSSARLYCAPRKEPLMYVKSDVRTSGDVLDLPTWDAVRRSPRHDICMMTQVKYTSYLLAPWVDYHRHIGVDKVYILDNDDDEDLSLQFRGRADVDVLYWPWQKSQSQAFNYMLTETVATCKWLVLTDCDEYIMLGLGKNNVLADQQPLRRFARRLESKKRPGAALHYVVMGNSGVIRRPNVAPPEAYVHFHPAQVANIKVMVLQDFYWRFSSVHSVAEYGWLYPTKQNWTLYPRDEDSAPALVHFKFRSVEEMNLKKVRGSGSTIDRQRSDGSLLAMSASAAAKYVDEKYRYTHFRNVWRAVMRAPWRGRQSVARINSRGEACVREMELQSSSEARFHGPAKCAPAQEWDEREWAAALRNKSSIPKSGEENWR